MPSVWLVSNRFGIVPEKKNTNLHEKRGKKHEMLSRISDNNVEEKKTFEHFIGRNGC